VLQTKLAIRQLSGAREYSVSYRILRPAENPNVIPLKGAPSRVRSGPSLIAWAHPRWVWLSMVVQLMIAWKYNVSKVPWHLPSELLNITTFSHSDLTFFCFFSTKNKFVFALTTTRPRSPPQVLMATQTDIRLTASFQDNLGKPTPERLNQSGFYWSKRWWGGSGISWTICKSFAPRSRQITTLTPHHSIFTGRMLFLTPNQHCQSTEATHWTEM